MYIVVSVSLPSVTDPRELYHRSGCESPKSCHVGVREYSWHAAHGADEMEVERGGGEVIEVIIDLR